MFLNRAPFFFTRLFLLLTLSLSLSLCLPLPLSLVRARNAIFVAPLPPFLSLDFYSM